MKLHGLSLLPLVPLVPLALASLTGCNPPVVTVEVLPPRSGVSCSTPGVDDPALGRGLLDAHAVTDNNGAYRADLRMVVTGANARIDGIDVRVTRDGNEVELLGDVPTGDVLLVGEGDDIRKGVVENVELLPRSIALDLSADDDITTLDLATLELEISPIVIDADVTPVSSTFALDVCRGCLVDEPDDTACPSGFFQNSVCRVGQDAELFSCLPPGAGAGG